MTNEPHCVFMSFTWNVYVRWNLHTFQHKIDDFWFYLNVIDNLLRQVKHWKVSRQFSVFQIENWKMNPLGTCIIDCIGHCFMHQSNRQSSSRKTTIFINRLFLMYSSIKNVDKTQGLLKYSFNSYKNAYNWSEKARLRMQNSF